MLKGPELGAAIREAMRLKGVTQKEVAAEFDIKQPSVSEWLRFGRIDKGHLNHLVAYFGDVVAPSHWGLGDVSTLKQGTSSSNEPKPERPQEGTVSLPRVQRLAVSANLQIPEAHLFVQLLVAAKVPGVKVEVMPWIEKPKEAATATSSQEAEQEKRATRFGRTGVITTPTKTGKSKRGAA